MGTDFFSLQIHHFNATEKFFKKLLTNEKKGDIIVA